MIINRLYDAVESRGPVCVGLDTDLEYIPNFFRDKYPSIEDALFQYNKKIIDATLDVSGCYKVQIAYYEAYGLQGMKAYKKTLDYLHEQKTIVIADIKRGDIAKTAEMYARAHFEGDFESDFITLNPYMGFDSLEPYLPYVKNKEKGLFVLIRTSNPGAKDIQYLENNHGQKVYHHVGKTLNRLGESYIGSCGYSSIGGVIGCTHLEEGQVLREQLKNMFFLVPGYGAQGGAGKEVSVYLKNGNGGIVNSSRAVLLAYKKKDDGEKRFDECARDEVIRMREEIQNAL